VAISGHASDCIVTLYFFIKNILIVVRVRLGVLSMAEVRQVQIKGSDNVGSGGCAG